MGNISFQYPFWVIIIVILAAFVFAGLLYFRDKKFRDKSLLQSRLLAAMRFLAVAIGGVLLMGPYLRKVVEDTRRPSVVVLMDNSLSVGEWLGDENQAFFREQMKILDSKLSEKFDVDNYLFGESIEQNPSDSLRFDSRLTNISDALGYANDVYQGGNLGAIILATDGIYNDGKNPTYTRLSTSVPIYSLALGDTTRKKDLLIKQIYNNEVSYLNDKIGIEVDIQAFNANNERAILIFEKEEGGKYIEQSRQNITLRGDQAFQTVQLEEVLDEPGVLHYRVRLTRLNNESNYINNTRDVFVEVLDSRQSILIVAQAPHPDLGAIRQLLETNKSYEVNIEFDLPGAAQRNAADLVIFHNLPSRTKDITPFISELNARKTPRMFILGSQTYLPRFNQIQDDLTINAQTNSTNDAQAIPDEGFNYFNLDPDVLKRVAQYPPIQSIFGEYTLTGRVRTLLRQKIGSVNTDYPLLSFSDHDGIKTAYLFGEGIWRWKLFDFMQTSAFLNIGALLDNSVIYTSTKEDKRKFRVSSSQKIFNENEDVVFFGELYNNSYQLVNDPDVFLEIINPQSEAFNFTFSKKGQSYVLNTGKFSPGQYRFNCSTVYNGERFETTGRFTVGAISYELSNTEANYNTLYELSQTNGGSVHFLSAIDRLAEEVLENDTLKPVMYQTASTEQLIDNKWIFFLLVLLLGGEWFVRRYLGSL